MRMHTLSQKLLIFDCDGVIVDSIDYYLELTKRVCLMVGHQRLPTREDFFKADGTIDGILRQIEVPAEKMDEFLQAAQSIYSLPLDENVQIAVVPGIPKVLNELAPKCRLIVISANMTYQTREVLKRHGLIDHFQLVIGGDVAGSKSSKIHEVLSQFNAYKKDVYMIGDMTGDIREGHKAGVNTVAVTWGYHSKEALSMESPTYLLESPVELLVVFQNNQ